MQTNTDQDIINNIRSLQSTENQLYTQLGMLPSNENSENQKDIINQINKVSQSRMNLYKNLSKKYADIQKDDTFEKQDLKNKTYMIQQNEKQLARMREQNINNLRLTEINRYYGQKYKAYYGVFLRIIMACIAMIIIIVLRQRYLISSRTTNILAIIIIIVSLFLIIPALLDIFVRNNLIFDEYDFYFDQDHPEGDVSSGTSTNIMSDAERYERELRELAEGECLGPSCCRDKGLSYDPQLSRCVFSSGSTTEPFISGQSTQFPGASLNDPCTMSKQLVNTDRSGKYYSISPKS